MKSLRTISKLLINILCLRYQLVKIAGPSRLCTEWCPDSRPDQARPGYTIPYQTRPGPDADPDSEAATATWLLFIMPCCCWCRLMLSLLGRFCFCCWLLLVGSVRLTIFFFFVFDEGGGGVKSVLVSLRWVPQSLTGFVFGSWFVCERQKQLLGLWQFF